LPPKIAYFWRQMAYFRRLLAAENACSGCSGRGWRDPYMFHPMPATMIR
jgi:hypothetical protein